MSDPTTLSIEDGIGILTVDSPPVNALGAAVRQGIAAGIASLDADPAVAAIVLICAGRTFFAGADISEFGKAVPGIDLRQLLERIERAAKPVVAAIHGTALGGGLELALVCGWRIAVPSAKLGLPEVNLGLLPGAGGTQRLPRLVGAEAALDLMTSGRPVAAAQALELGIIDALAAEGRLRQDAIQFAHDRLKANDRPVRVRDRDDRLAAARGNPAIFDEFRKRNARAFKGFKAPENIVKAVEAAVMLPFDDGLTRERELFDELIGSRESAAQRYAFFAERQTAKIPDGSADAAPLPIETVGVVGAGTMGGGIAMNFLNAGIPVTLVETSREALDRGLGVIRRNYENSAKKGRIGTDEVERRLGLIRPSLALDDLAQADLVIEAIFESMPVKQELFGKLDAVVRPGAILASNTSYLDLDEIAGATERPDWVVGLHFFSPANVMRLLEVVRGARTAKPVIATAMALAKTIGKVPVLSRVCHGFIANRMMRLRTEAAERLVLEGPSAAEIDRVIRDYGFAMGPFQMMDLVGLDVIGRDNPERSLRGDLVAAGRLGQKQNGGFYDYDESRNPTPSPVAAGLIAEFAAHRGITETRRFTPEEILARLLYPVVNEGARIVEEGVALRASDVDIAALLGYNWPVYTGGPMFWADTVGLATLVDGLKKLAAEGASTPPAALLERLAEAGGSLAKVGAGER